jgi:hypothetical protein
VHVRVTTDAQSREWLVPYGEARALRKRSSLDAMALFAQRPGVLSYERKARIAVVLEEQMLPPEA